MEHLLKPSSIGGENMAPKWDCKDQDSNVWCAKLIGTYSQTCCCNKCERCFHKVLAGCDCAEFKSFSLDFCWKNKFDIYKFDIYVVLYNFIRLVKYIYLSDFVQADTLTYMLAVKYQEITVQKAKDDDWGSLEIHKKHCKSRLVYGSVVTQRWEMKMIKK